MCRETEFASYWLPSGKWFAIATINTMLCEVGTANCNSHPGSHGDKFYWFNSKLHDYLSLYSDDVLKSYNVLLFYKYLQHWEKL